MADTYCDLLTFKLHLELTARDRAFRGFGNEAWRSEYTEGATIANAISRFKVSSSIEIYLQDYGNWDNTFEYFTGIVETVALKKGWGISGGSKEGPVPFNDYTWWLRPVGN